MSQQTPQAEDLEVKIISIDRSKLHSNSLQAPTCSRNSTPMERWNNEAGSQQAWHALASFTRDENWKESAGQQQSASMKAEVGSGGSKE